MSRWHCATRWVGASLFLLASLVVPAGGEARAEPKAEKVFAAVITDAQGIETEIKNVVFYWEEKVNETSFVPHELRHLPVKRGNTTNNIPFDKINQVGAKPSGSEGITVLVRYRPGSETPEQLADAGHRALVSGWNCTARVDCGKQSLATIQQEGKS